jgi:hypothetical protein
VALASFSGLSKKQLSELQLLVEEHKREIEKAWKKHFSS